jgi:two-component system, sporulation sensor kinase C
LRFGKVEELHSQAEKDVSQSKERNYIRNKQKENDLKANRDIPETMCAEQTLELKRNNEQLQREISSLQQVARKLRESENKYRALVETSLQGIVIFQGPPAHIVFANSAAEDILGRSAQELLSCSHEQILEAIHPEDRSAAKRRYSNRMAGNPEEHRYELRFQNRDGSVRWVEVYGTRVEFDGKPSILGTFVDITNRKLTEAALTESERISKVLINAIPQPTLLVDVEGTVIVANTTTGERLGKDLDKIIGSCIFDHLPPDVVNSRRIYLEEIIRTGLPVHFEDIYEGRYIENHYFPIRDAQGKVAKIAIVAHNISERKKAEKQKHRYIENLESMVEERAKRIQELEHQRAQAEKFVATGRMAAGVAHEINNPLAGIKNSFLLIKDAIPKDHPYSGYVGRIQKEIDRIANIIRQLFDLYRPDQEVIRQFVLDDLIHDVVALMQVSCERVWKDKIRIGIREGDKPVKMALQEGLLRQVLYNLLQNAIDASPPEGLVEVSVKTDKNVVTMTVTDQGTGISEEIRSAIFEPFVTTKSGACRGSLGLGLSVSRNLVELMGGTIDFSSEKGKRTIFRITLPIHQ